MITGIDHAVILGEDLDRLVAQYTQLGFQVVPGGRHARFTHNALIPFSDGTYIELIAYYEAPESADNHRWYRLLQSGGGLIDFALISRDLEATLSDARSKGLELEGPQPGYRQRPDNVELRWALGVPPDRALPFLIEDVSERSLRVPGEGTEHDNQVHGIHSIAVAVTDLDRAIQRYNQLLGVEEPTGSSLKNIDGADGVYYILNDFRIDVAVPTGEGIVADRLNLSGEGPVQIELLSRTTQDFPPSQTGNVHLRFVAG